MKWSYWLSKIKKSITNSKPISEVIHSESKINYNALNLTSIFFQQQYAKSFTAELLIAANSFAIIWSLLEAQYGGELSIAALIGNLLLFNWIVLAQIAMMDVLLKKYFKIDNNSKIFLCTTFYFYSFLIFLCLILVTTIVLNIVLFWREAWSFSGLLLVHMFRNSWLNLGYALCVGLLSFRFIYLRMQWFELKDIAQDATIQAHHSSIQPHFLFNSLNTVVSLISVNPDRAEQTLIHLSKVFRASIQQKNLVNLDYEIELCRYYLDIQHLRLGGRMQVNWKINGEDYLSIATIPILTLQPVLENCIFHGVEQQLSVANINILVEISPSRVTIVITNPLLQNRINKKQGQGYALQNIQLRLISFYGKESKIRRYISKELYITHIEYAYRK